MAFLVNDNGETLLVITYAEIDILEMTVKNIQHKMLIPWPYVYFCSFGRMGSRINRNDCCSICFLLEYVRLAKIVPVLVLIQVLIHVKLPSLDPVFWGSCRLGYHIMDVVRNKTILKVCLLEGCHQPEADNHCSLCFPVLQVRLACCGIGVQARRRRGLRRLSSYY